MTRAPSWYVAGPLLGLGIVLLRATLNKPLGVLVAGMAMGFGARTAGGCALGHGLTGMSLGSPASLVATFTFFAVGVGVTHLLFARL